MLLRAFFWIALVAVMMPHEPDLGLGRPGGTSLLPQNLSLPRELANPSQICNGHEQACGSAFGFVDWFQQNAVHSLALVKVQIEEQQRERAKH